LSEFPSQHQLLPTHTGDVALLGLSGETGIGSIGHVSQRHAPSLGAHYLGAYSRIMQ
jgi:hypothetical protein